MAASLRAFTGGPGKSPGQAKPSLVLEREVEGHCFGSRGLLLKFWAPPLPAVLFSGEKRASCDG